jgi:STE24 endopeptidase
MPEAARVRAPRLWLSAVVVLLVGIGMWLVVSHWLWPTTVPAGLRLPRLDPAHFFSHAFLVRSASYERFLDVDSLLTEVTLLGVLVVYARRGHRLMRESAAGPIGTGMLLGMLAFAIVWLAELPFGLTAVWWERRHGISHQGYIAWVVQSFSALGGRFAFISLALLIAMGLARLLRGWWWVAAAPAFGALALLSAFLTIYLIPSVHPLRDPVLLAEARALERVEGVSATKVEVQDVSRFTTAPNAEAVGFGSTSRVILWDTLVNGGFTRRQVRSVIAHELTHVSRRHVLKGVGWFALFLIPITLMIALATARHGGMGRPEAVPVALLVFVAASLALTPIHNVISRRMEAEADWGSLRATHDPAGARGLMLKLARTSLSNPDPPVLSYVMEADHPTIMQRLAMIDAWEGRLRRP